MSDTKLTLGFGKLVRCYAQRRQNAFPETARDKDAHVRTHRENATTKISHHAEF